ncbi:MAG: SOS response-associated peptidase [Leptospiraceae bacterium]|nr:SOS response-associated peptidase [Leptospiraceae bacterium]MDW7976114.1 SOS response-associated peptidase [Leptospiraceae bacterium]
MCFSVRIHSSIDDIINRFQVQFYGSLDSLIQGDLLAFTHPYLPVITKEKPNELLFFRWGLIPNWAKNEEIAKHTLNARWETLSEKPAFKDYTQNRCLIIVNGFYEWKWLDPKGKRKEKYYLTLQENPSEPFAIGGIYNFWKNPKTNQLIPTFTLITQPANKLMEEIHNSKKRMPLLLTKETERDWLLGKIHEVPDVKLQATKIQKSTSENFQLL